MLLNGCFTYVKQCLVNWIQPEFRRHFKPFKEKFYTNLVYGKEINVCMAWERCKLKLMIVLVFLMETETQKESNANLTFLLSLCKVCRSAVRETLVFTESLGTWRAKFLGNFLTKFHKINNFWDGDFGEYLGILNIPQ